MKFIYTRVCVLNCFPFLGRRGGSITLGYILRFVSGSEKEPLLGFRLHPSIVFGISLRFTLRSHCVRYCQLVNPFFLMK